MEIGTYFGQVGHSPENPVVVFLRGVAGNELEPFDSVDVAQQFEEVGEAVCFVAGFVFVGVDSLAEEGDLLCSGVGEFLCLSDDSLWRSRGFGSSDVWYDAIGAELVAASHRSDVCL